MKHGIPVYDFTNRFNKTNTTGATSGAGNDYPSAGTLESIPSFSGICVVHFFLLYFKRFIANLFMFCPIFYLPVYYLFIELGYHIYCLHSFPDKFSYTTEVFGGRGKYVMRLIEQWINKSEVTNLTQVSNIYQCIISRSIVGRKQEANNTCRFYSA